jgi:hypothetical protein
MVIGAAATVDAKALWEVAFDGEGLQVGRVGANPVPAMEQIEAETTCAAAPIGAEFEQLLIGIRSTRSRCQTVVVVTRWRNAVVV